MSKSTKGRSIRTNSGSLHRKGVLPSGQKYTSVRGPNGNKLSTVDSKRGKTVKSGFRETIKAYVDGSKQRKEHVTKSGVTPAGNKYVARRTKAIGGPLDGRVSSNSYSLKKRSPNGRAGNPNLKATRYNASVTGATGPRVIGKKKFK